MWKFLHWISYTRNTEKKCITARDYAFSLLLRMEPEIEKLGGTPEELKQIAGYQNYVTARKAYVEELERNTGKHYTKLYIVGGGAKNKYLNRLTEEAIGRQVIALPIEATALGNLRIQMEAEKA